MKLSRHAIPLFLTYKEIRDTWIQEAGAIGSGFLWKKEKILVVANALNLFIF